ncbi:hypothetical protein ACROYT_G008671 [Oculina patagonica]
MGNRGELQEPEYELSSLCGPRLDTWAVAFHSVRGHLEYLTLGKKARLKWCVTMPRECPLECQNGGKLNTLMCTCACPPGWKGLDCSDAVKICPLGFYGKNCQFNCVDKVGTEVCHWRISNGYQCSAPYMQLDCAASCGVCGSQAAPTTKPSLLLTTPIPQVIQTRVSPVHLPVTSPVMKPPAPGNSSTMTTSSNVPTTKPLVAASTIKPSLLLTTPKPQVIQTKIPSVHFPVTSQVMKPPSPGKTSRVTISNNATATKPAVAASVVLSNKTTNVTLSIGPVAASNVSTTESPRVIANKPSSVLPVTQSLNPLNMTLDQLKEVNKYVSLSKLPIGDASKTHCRDKYPSTCTLLSVMEKCNKSKWMKKYCCGTCKRVMDTSVGRECKDSNPLKCPFWALAGECTRDRLWMLGNCRKSCNQCGVCKDVGPKCTDLALSRKCIEGDKRHLMLTNCPQSCGLCQVYDKHDYCPAWAARDECRKSNWTWMRDNCPLSCRIPLFEVQFCGRMKDGNYPIPRICTGFVSCSGGVTRHEMCPNGTLFNPVKRFCDLPQNVSCSHEKDLTLKKSHIGQ